MRLFDKIKEIQKDNDPRVMQAFKEMQEIGKPDVFIESLQKAADLFIREIKYANHHTDFVSGATYQQYAATCMSMVQDAKQGKNIDRKNLYDVSETAKRLGSREVCKARNAEDLSKNPVLYEAIINENSAAEFSRNEIARAIRNGNISCTITEGGIHFESKVFSNGGIDLPQNGIVKNDPVFYADQLAFESAIGRQSVDINKLTEMNLAKQKRQMQMDIEH